MKLRGGGSNTQDIAEGSSTVSFRWASSDVFSEAAGDAAVIFSRFNMCGCVVAAAALKQMS